jgi:tryptophan synthase alpha chain
MNRIDSRFAALRKAARTGLIPFVTAGDPDPAWSVEILHALVAAGADAIELGVPFSDPMADGPVIQRASERALARGVGLRRVLEMVRAFRATDAATPVVLMGYLNPVEIYGLGRFAADAGSAGVDGVLLVDLPPEEAMDVDRALEARGIARISLAAPTTSPERLARIAASARGFLYYVSFAGITGADRLALDAVNERLASLRRSATAPLAVGFGVREPAQAAALARNADAVVVGSALVERIAQARDKADACRIAREFLVPLRQALDRVRHAS